MHGRGFFLNGKCSRQHAFGWAKPFLLQLRFVAFAFCGLGWGEGKNSFDLLVLFSKYQSFFGENTFSRCLCFVKNGFFQQPVKILLKIPRKNLSVLENLP